ELEFYYCFIGPLWDNAAERLWQYDKSNCLPPGHAAGACGHHLSLRDRLHRAAKVLGLIGGRVQRDSDNRAGEGVEDDAELWQPQVNEKHLDQHRCAAKHLDIDRTDSVEQP